MNRINFNNLGGFPTTQFTLSFLQSAYKDALSALASLIGDGVILTGMVETGSNVSDGWISWNGELLFFQGGPKQTTFIISETVTSKTYADDVLRPAYYTRFARFGAGGNTYANLIRLETIVAMKTAIGSLTTGLMALQEGLSLHADDTNNPHGVKFSQLTDVERSDAIDEDSSDKIATSKAIYTLAQMISASNRILYVGSQAIGDIATDSLFTINHAQNIQVAYRPFPVLRFTSGDWNANNDVMFVTGNIQPNSFQIAVREVSTQTQNLTVDYQLIKL